MNSQDRDAGHRHAAAGQHEHEFEPQHGLPELLPEGEHLLWQGAPDWRLLATSRFHLRKLVVYFALLLAARVAAQLESGLSLPAALAGSLGLFALAALALALLAFMAWMTARTTVYTLTDRRVVMRIGIVLTLTLNLPFKRMQGADLALLGRHGRGDIALQLQGPDRIAYVHLWPHARRWRYARPEPTLLCVPDAQAVAARLTEAWCAVNGAPARPAPVVRAARAGALPATLAAR